MKELLEEGGDLVRREFPTTLQAGKEFFHSPYAFSQYLLTCFLKRNYDKGISIANHADKTIWIRGDNFYAVIDLLATKHGFKYISAGDQLVFEREDAFVTLELLKSNEFSKVLVFSPSRAVAQEIVSDVAAFDANVRNLSFYWLVNAKGDSVSVVEEWEEQVDKDLYPFISQFDKYAESFWSSKANILILIGPPGTGKTTFIKHLLSYNQKRAYVTYDEAVLSNDEPFANFISDDEAGSFIIEDADLFLKSRAEGNGMVSRFLNIGDGLIKLKNKKLIFSTNLPSTKDIDSALIRPGRCFDILNFRSLTRDEAEVVANARDLELQGDSKEFTLAEIFNSPIATKQVGQRMGFY